MRWDNRSVWLAVVFVGLLLAVPAASRSRPVPLPVEAQRTIDGLVAGAGSSPLLSEAVPEPDSYADRLCDTPQNLTGAIVVSSVASGWTSDPQEIVWDGAAYGLAYTGPGYNATFARVAPDGTLLAGPTVVDSGSGSCHHLAIDWTGSEYGVAWFDDRTGDYEIYFARVAADGQLVSGSEVRVTTDASASTNPSLAWAGTEWGLVWSDTRSTASDIYFARINAAGAKVGSDVQVTNNASTSDYPSLEWAGDRFGLAWEDSRTTAGDIYFRPLWLGGAPAGSEIQLTVDAGTSSRPTVAWSGSVFGIAWVDTRTTTTDIYFARVSSINTKIGGDVQVTSTAGDSGYPDLKWTGSEFGVVWADNRNGAWDPYFARINGAGVKVGGDVAVSLDSSPYLAASSLAFGTKGYGLVYRTNGSKVTFIGMGCHADTTPPSCPESPGETGRTATSVTLAWGASRDLETELGVYKVYRDSALVATLSAGTTSWTDTAFAPGAGSLYRITAANAAGLESVGCASVDTTDAVPPTCPSDLRVTARTTTTLTLSWGASSDGLSGVAGYRVYKNYALSTTTTSLTWTDSAYSASSGALYQVVALDGAGNESEGCASVDTGDTTPPSCPGGLREISRTANILQFVWNASLDPESGVPYYRVYRDGTLIASANVSLGYGDGSFNPAAGYIYYVTAVNGAGLESQGCAMLDTTDATPPTCAENLLASGVTASQARLDWLPAQDALSGLKQYRLYRNDLALATVPAGTTTYTDATLSGGTAYNFAVKSEDYAGNLAPLCASSTVWISTAPILLFLTKDGDGVHADLDWNDVGINTYVVYRSTSAQASGELKRVVLSETQDAVLKDDVRLWFYYIQQRE